MPTSHGSSGKIWNCNWNCRMSLFPGVITQLQLPWFQAVFSFIGRRQERTLQIHWILNISSLNCKTITMGSRSRLEGAAFYQLWQCFTLLHLVAVFKEAHNISGWDFSQLYLQSVHRNDPKSQDGGWDDVIRASSFFMSVMSTELQSYWCRNTLICLTISPWLSLVLSLREWCNI